MPKQRMELVDGINLPTPPLLEYQEAYYVPQAYYNQAIDLLKETIELLEEFADRDGSGRFEEALAAFYSGQSLEDIFEETEMTSTDFRYVFDTDNIYDPEIDDEATLYCRKS